MSYRKFGKNDLLVNTLRAHPKVSFDIWNGSVYYNNQGIKTGHFRLHPNNVYMTDPGYENLHEINIDRLAGSNPLIYPYLPKDGSRTSLYMDGDSGALSDSDYADKGFGDLFTGSYPQFTSIRREFITSPSGSCDNLSKADCGHNMTFFTLKNYLDHYSTLSPHYKIKMDNTFQGGWDKNSQNLNIIHVPSIFYGTKIKPGTLKLRFYQSGSLIGELSDEKQNGELIQTLPTGSIYSGSVAGVALYNEGFLVLTGSWPLQDTSFSSLEYLGFGSGEDTKFPRWIYWGCGVRDGITINNTGSNSVATASFSLNFEGETRTNVLTMNAHAPRGKANFSNNPTFVKKGQRFFNVTSSQVYEENSEKEIKNTVSSSFVGFAEDFKRQVYISKIGIYDENKNLIGVATLADPVLKEEKNNYTFRIKLDL